MKTIGLLGGMSWESSQLYYQYINQEIQKKLGKLHSAKIILMSVDFAEIEVLQHQDRWDEAGLYLQQKALQLQHAGAESIFLCTNTMHKVSVDIENALSIPFIHIADVTATEILKCNINKIGLLGTAFTMEQQFYKGRLEDYGLNVIIPELNDRQIIHNIIYQELCKGIVKPSSKEKFINIIANLIAMGAEGIILGCTEICMLINPNDVSIPTFDTTTLHAKAAVEFALSKF